MGSASLAPGANARVPENGQLLVVVGWEPNNRQGVQIDAFAFMIGADGRVSSDHYFVFYGSQVSPEGSVRFVPSPSSGNACEVRTFNVEPGKVPADVQSIDVCVVIRGSPAGGPSFGSLDNASALLTDLRSGQEIARFELPVEGMKETAITLVKIYRRNGQWKVRAVGQGFAGGFPALASHYGVGIADGAPLSTSTENTPAPPPRATPSTPAPPTKVTLAKRGQSVSLEKKGGEGFGQIVINLNWNQRPRRKGSLLGGLLGGSKGIDLDLGCLWELLDLDVVVAGNLYRILYWGILGALVFRAIFVGVGTGVFHLAPWVGFAFAAIVAWSGYKMLMAGGDDGEITDYSDHWSVRMTEKIMPIFPRLHAERFFVTRTIVKDLAAADRSIRTAKDAAVFATPALLCLMAIETSDIMFAFDSVPAVIAITQEPLLVYAAMIFAILGLRSLYFVLAALTKYLVHLEKAVIALLFFIAAKLTLQSGEHAFGWSFLHVSSDVSLLIVLGTLGAGIIASLIWPIRREEAVGVAEAQSKP